MHVQFSTKGAIINPSVKIFSFFLLRDHVIESEETIGQYIGMEKNLNVKIGKQLMSFMLTERGSNNKQ